MKWLANAVTLFRLVLLVPIAWLLSIGSQAAARGALALLVVAGGSDALDGWLARRLNACSPVGAFLDPLVDKLLANVLLVFFAWRFPDRVEPWIVLALLARELIVQGVRSMAPCKGVVIRTRLVSKSKFLFQVLCLVATVASLAWPAPAAAAVFLFVARTSLWAALVTGYVSMVRILWTARDLWTRDDVPLEMR